MSRMRRILLPFLVVVLLLGGAVASAEPQAPDAPDGAHPLQDHWGQSAAGAGTGFLLTSNNGIALYARSSSGVYPLLGYNLAAAGTNYGAYGLSRSTAGTGVLGQAIATSGSTKGVYGLVSSPSGIGVYGAGGYLGTYGTGTSYGVYGNGNYGVYGNGSYLGTYGRGSTYGAYGIATAATGTTYGVRGAASSPSGAGVYGSGGYQGVYGIGAYGVEGWTNTSYGYAGWFQTSVGNGVRVATPTGKVGLLVTGGSKNAAVPTSSGMRLLSSEESTEVWFTDYGSQQTRNGSTTVAIDPIFAETVDLTLPYHVFTQVYGDADIFVTNRTAKGFEVRVRDGAPDVEFSYRIVAKRLGFQTQRLEVLPEEKASGRQSGANASAVTAAASDVPADLAAPEITAVAEPKAEAVVPTGPDQAEIQALMNNISALDQTVDQSPDQQEPANPAPSDTGAGANQLHLPLITH